MQLNKLERFAVVIVLLTLGCGFLALTISRSGGKADLLKEAQSNLAAEQQPKFRRLDLNQATLDELVTLPGIGPTRAEAILRLRRQRGGFNQIDDLLAVRGIGKRTLELIEPYVCIGKAVSKDHE